MTDECLNDVSLIENQFLYYKNEPKANQLMLTFVTAHEAVHYFLRLLIFILNFVWTE